MVPADVGVVVSKVHRLVEFRRKQLKGAVLAEGPGSRLKPLTAVANKRLLPVFDQPVIYYPIKPVLTPGMFREALPPLRI